MLSDCLYMCYSILLKIPVRVSVLTAAQFLMCFTSTEHEFANCFQYKTASADECTRRNVLGVKYLHNTTLWPSGSQQTGENNGPICFVTPYS